jgi:enterochelin esterase-like enzyme
MLQEFFSREEGLARERRQFADAPKALGLDIRAVETDACLVRREVEMASFETFGALLSDADEAVMAAARRSATPELPREALTDAGVKGQLRVGRHIGAEGSIWPKVGRNWQVYVPASGQGPFNLIVFQDGQNYLSRTHAANVLDVMIAEGTLAPTVALFVEPGDLDGFSEGSRGNRSLEYDSLNDAYLRLLVDELFPAALADLPITSDPEARAIAGMSSGGICAFNAAWERPDLFGLVLSHVGSFTSIRGGHAYPSRVRGNGRKPIRVFLQAGENDLNNTMGHWPTANIDMAHALAFRGYDFRFEMGPGAHTFDHAAAILPQALKWLFR